MKRYKPTTASRRHMTGILYRKVLTATKPEKSLTTGIKRDVGRSSKGRISVRHKGGGHKRLWREIDFKYEKKDIPAKIKSIEYDPNRSAFIALVTYSDGIKRYVVASANSKVGDEMIISEKAAVASGNRLELKNIPVGTQIFNVEIKPGGGAKLARSAGNAITVLAHDEGWSQIKMPSGEIRKINSRAYASVGQVSNSEHNLVVIGKAGRSRWMGKRPTVRGSAMNPVDHPLGGGEGRAPAGLKKGAKNKWGKGKRGVKTRHVKKYSKVFIVSRRKKKKRKK